MAEPTRAQEPVPSRLVLLFVALSCLLLLACTGDPAPESEPPFPDREDIAATIAERADVIFNMDQVRAIVAATDDRIVFEQYYGAVQDDYWDVYSITKSVISTLVGIALDEGLIDGLDDTLAELLPGYADDMPPAVAGATLHQLLTMTAGFPAGQEAAGPAFTQAEDWVHEILATPASSPGGPFLYSNGTSHLLAAILEEATGSSALDYARSRLFEPLGIDTRPAGRDVVTPTENLAAHEKAGFAWPVDPQGISTGWWGLKLQPRDMVKLGQLFLADGRWEGQQVVPADWVDQATTQHVDVDVDDKYGYGYQWWTGTADESEAFQAIGYGGQLIEVIPDRHLVVVATTEAHLDDATRHGIDPDLLLTILDDAIVSRMPAE